jgi:hypothetical protein
MLNTNASALISVFMIMDRSGIQKKVRANHKKEQQDSKTKAQRSSKNK